MRGAGTIEQEITLKPSDHLHLAAWLREVASARFLSLSVERPDRPSSWRPKGKSAST